MKTITVGVKLKRVSDNQNPPNFVETVRVINEGIYDSCVGFIRETVSNEFAIKKSKEIEAIDVMQKIDCSLYISKGAFRADRYAHAIRMYMIQSGFKTKKQKKLEKQVKKERKNAGTSLEI